METIKRVFHRSDVANLSTWQRALSEADVQAAAQLGPATRTIHSEGEQVIVEWSAKLQQKLEAEIPRIQSAQVIAKALVGKQDEMSITGASHASVSLKQMLADRKTKLVAAHDRFAANMGKLDEATAALDSLSNDVASEAADLLASIGQFKNDLGASNG